MQTLYNVDGAAVAYIDDGGSSIYLYSGKSRWLDVG